MVVSGGMFGEAWKDAAKELVKREVCKVFTAWRLCKTKDTVHQGCLHLQGIETVWCTQELEKEKKDSLCHTLQYGASVKKLLCKVGYQCSNQHTQITNLANFYLDF